MWQEIEAVLTDTQEAVQIDEVAAVAYVTWDELVLNISVVRYIYLTLLQQPMG